MVVVFLLFLSWLSIMSHGHSIPLSDICFGSPTYVTCDETKKVCDCQDKDTCHFKLVIEDSTTVAEEGLTIILVNGKFQGPTLIVNEGAKVMVDVVNNMKNEGTSIHWHGMHQISTPWMDGVGYITQWPIRPGGGKFRYTFKARPSGTFWYHSHVGTQRSRGFFGALILKEKTASVIPGFDLIADKPGDHTLVFLDFPREHMRKQSGSFNQSCYPDGSVDPSSVVGRSPVAMLNGEAMIKPEDFENVGKRGDIHKRKLSPRGYFSTFYADANKTYRFRLVGAMEGNAYRFSIDNHTLTVIAADGYLVQPFVTDYIILHSGERFDFLLTKKSIVDTEVKQFPIRTETLSYDCVSGKNLRDSGWAVLLYGTHDDDIDLPGFVEQFKTTSNPRGCSNEDPCLVMNCPFEHYGNEVDLQCHHVDELQLLDPTPPGQIPNSANIDLARTTFFNFHFVDNNTTVVNGIKLVLPSTPLQVTKYDDSEVCESNTCDITAGEIKECVHIATISDKHYMKSVRFVLSSLINGSSARTHPIHLHGHSFHVVKFGYPTYNENGKMEQINGDLVSCDGVRVGSPRWKDNTPPNGIASDGLTVRKDTVMIPAGGYVVIDFIADNPGYWFMHCHIDHHLEHGMGIAIRESKAHQNKPPECLTFNNTDFCCTLDLEKKGHGVTNEICCGKPSEPGYNYGHIDYSHVDMDHKDWATTNGNHKESGHKDRGDIKWSNFGWRNNGPKDYGPNDYGPKDYGPKDYGPKDWANTEWDRTLKEQRAPRASSRDQQARSFEEGTLKTKYLPERRLSEHDYASKENKPAILSDEDDYASKEKPVLSNEGYYASGKNTLSDKEDYVSKEKRVLSDEEEYGSKEKLILSNEEEYESKEKPILSDEEDYASKEKPILSNEEEYASKEKPILSDEEDYASKEKPILSNEEEYASKEKPILSDEEEYGSKEKPVLSDFDDYFLRKKEPAKRN